MKKILVTGCNGQLGRAINQVYQQSEVEFINTDVVEDEKTLALDITKIDQVIQLIEQTRPDVIINCAAHTNVNACETQWDAAYQINAIGPRNLSIAAEKISAKIIHVSTDYVFDGTAKEPINEFAPTSPNSAYGKTKNEGENFVRTFSSKHFILRTAWLYGDGNNFVKTMLKLAESNDKVKVVGDQFGTPTSALELARMIKFLEATENYGTFHATCEGECSWADFAVAIFKRAGLTTGVDYITTAEYPTPANRPAYSVLDNYMLRLTAGDQFVMANWEAALDEYMDTLVL